MRTMRTVALTALVLGLAAGCSASSPPAGKTSLAVPRLGRSCGTAYTAANVPVLVEVAKGTVSCSVALRVQGDYARKLRLGQAPGNGGGGPVQVDGWVCEGYPTPEVLQTGRASRCQQGTAQFFAVLPAPTASPAS